VKPLQRRVQEAAQAGRVDQIVVERDYAQSYVLLGIAGVETLRDTLVFKGGTALKKIHFGDYRFSEDLDFSAVNGPRGAALARALGQAISGAQAAARQWAPLTFSIERYEERDPHPGGQEAFIVRIQFPWQRQPMVPVKIEITHDEPVLLPAPPRPVQHGYDEPYDVAVRAYSLEEVGAEKLRCTRQTQAKRAARGWARSRARDFYDLWRLGQLPSGRIDWSLVAQVLPARCQLRAVAISSINDIFDPTLVGEVRLTWERTLGPFVPELPNVQRVLAETRAHLSRVLKLG
jgi:uncharacterized protein